MLLSRSIELLLAARCFISWASAASLKNTGTLSPRGEMIAPKVVIISMFEPEAAIWWGIDEFDLLAQNITVPGLSPLFPEVHCTATGDVCQIITGESEINAAGTVGAFSLSPKFDLTKTYFMVAGIAGINPELATTGAVTFAKYAVQVALQYEFDFRELPDNFTTGYIPLGAYSPDEYPQNIYGTEVFEVNENLRDIAVSFAKEATLNDTATAQAYRALYTPVAAYAAGAASPAVVPCDVATSDVYYSGDLLSTAFENTTKLFTNGSGIYCSTAQEDNASLSSLLRAASFNLTDFSRIIVMRTASDFDRPPPSVTPLQNLLYAEQGGFHPAIENIYLAGIKVVEGILDGWDSTFEAGMAPGNYIGDMFATLGGTPDFGLPAEFITKRSVNMKTQDVKGNVRMRKKAEAIRRARVE